MSNSDNVSDKTSDHFNDSLVKRITGAFTLITVGLFLLLNSTDVIPWSSWVTVMLIFVRIWPVFIIIAGLQLMFKNNFIRIILDVCSSLVFVIALLIAAYVNTSNSALKTEIEKNIPIIEMLRINVDSKDYTQTSLSASQNEFPLSEVKSREINLDFTSEKFNINVDESAKDYLNLDAYYNSNTSEPFLNSNMRGSTLVVDSGIKYLSKTNILSFLSNSNFKYTIGGSQIPTSMNIRMTSGNGEIDLTDLSIDNLTINETSGNLLADLSSTNIKSVQFEMTSGNSTLNFSKDSNIQIVYAKTSGNLKFNGESADSKSGRLSIGDTDSTEVVELNLKLTSGNMDVNTK